MRNFLLILLVIFPMFAFAQAIEVKYGVYSKERAKLIDNMKSQKENQKYQGMISGLSTERTDSFRLIIKDKISSFERIEPEEELSDDQGPEIIIVAPSYSEGNNSVYKFLAFKKVTELKDFLGRTYSITHPLTTYTWKVSTQRKSIMGLTTYMATIGDSITAWFCPDIPVQDGPGIYNGLPGLILDLEDPQTIYSCTLINTHSYLDVGKPKRAKEVTEEEFNQLRKRVFQKTYE